MEYIKKYKFVILGWILLIFLLTLSFFDKPEEVESVEVLESNIIEKEEVSTIKFEIKGAVKQSGVYEIKEDSRIVDAISLGGGLLKTADTSSINMSAKLTDAMVIDIPYQEVNNTIIKVDIKGCVTNPGVYEMNENDRVIDVINKSGGLKDNADTNNINLSKRVFDEMVIIISEETINNEVENEIVNDALIGEEQNKENVEEVENKEDITEEIIDKKISINNATKEELMTLSGIGESKALAIIEYRNNKKFESIEEITNVSGIGKSLYEKIKDNITL